MELKIRFTMYDIEFTVNRIRYEIDEEGEPIDIVIYGDKYTLECISEYAQIGCAMQKCEESDCYMKNLPDDTYEILCARLPHFTVVGGKKCVRY